MISAREAANGFPEKNLKKFIWNLLKKFSGKLLKESLLKKKSGGTPERIIGAVTSGTIEGYFRRNS